MVHESHPSQDISRNDAARPRFVIPLSLIQRAIIVEVRRCGGRKGGSPWMSNRSLALFPVHALRVIVFFQRVLDPVTRFGRERMIGHEINLFSSLRALVHRIPDKQHLLPTACTEFTHEKMKSESKTLI